ncbi:MAG: hypothetical protein H6732_09230 [Alphaproteobacteria bacterium]|nr:hypothetical protein [Alphaproteobacteria bacterium]
MVDEDPRARARRLAAEAKARVEAQAAAKATKRSLLDRAPKPVSAQDALRKALEEEKEAEQAKAKAAVAAKSAKARAPRPPAPKPAPPPTLKDPTALLGQRLPDAQVVSVVAVTRRDAFQAVWTAHRVRAATSDDLPLLISADVLTDASKRLPAGALQAARVRKGDAELAVFVDVQAGVLLGALAPADLYLAGVS